MIKNEKIALAIVAGSVLASPSAQADATAVSQKFAVPAFSLTREQMVVLGFDTSAFINRAGVKRSLFPQEVVKVEVHEENGSINFSSFDDYALIVNNSMAASTPRNIGGADFDR